jgi:S1-C subfamily serine protease
VSTAPWSFGHQPEDPKPQPTRARVGTGRGILLGLLLGAIIGAFAFGLGRLTAPDDAPSAASLTQVTVPSTSLVGNTSPPPVATVPQADGAVEPVVAAAAVVTPAVVQLNTTLGTGSGVIYSAEGYILTAAHVVGNATNVSVRFADGSRTTGSVVGADETTDVAVVMIDPAEVPAVAVLGTGLELSVGQTAVAVGSPFELDQTVTSGIISAVDRIVGADRISMVQTDAAINPGNSGGPLVDLKGRVLGINDVIFTNSGDNAGVGFAISIDLAKIVADQITAGEPVSTALLGVSVGASTEGDAGGLVSEVSPDSAADLAGIEVGDLIIAFDGDPLRGPSELRAEVITRAPGTEVDIVLIRDGEQLTIRVVLGSAGG